MYSAIFKVSLKIELYQLIINLNLRPQSFNKDTHIRWHQKMIYWWRSWV